MELNNLRKDWNIAPSTVSSLCVGIQLTEALLKQIQQTISYNAGVMNCTETVQALDGALTSCTTNNAELEKIMNGIKNAKASVQPQNFTAKMRFKTLWNDCDAKRLAGRIKDTQLAMDLLINALHI